MSPPTYYQVQLLFYKGTPVCLFFEDPDDANELINAIRTLPGADAYAISHTDKDPNLLPRNLWVPKDFTNA